MPESLVAANTSRHVYFVASVDPDEREASKKAHSNHCRVDYPPRTANRYIEGLRDEVIHALASLGYPSLDAVDCKVSAGRVVLSGSLPSYHLKQLAQVAALRVAGPGHVDNQVVVATL